MSHNDIFQWLRRQTNVVIVNEGNKSRVGVLTLGKQTVDRTWFGGDSLDQAIVSAASALTDQHNA